MKVIDRAVTPDGIQIQLEDWHENNTEEYPLLYGYTIAAYPIAKNTSKYGWIRSGSKFRLDISCNNYRNYIDEMVLADYEALKNGTKTLEDLQEHFYNGNKDKYYLGLIWEDPSC